MIGQNVSSTFGAMALQNHLEIKCFSKHSLRAARIKKAIFFCTLHASIILAFVFLLLCSSSAPPLLTPPTLHQKRGQNHILQITLKIYSISLEKRASQKSLLCFWCFEFFQIFFNVWISYEDEGWILSMLISIIIKLKFQVLTISAPWIRVILFYSGFIDFKVLGEIRGGTKLQI